MCWECSYKEFTFKVCDRPFITYKIVKNLDNRYHSWYHDEFVWEFNKLYNTFMQFSTNTKNKILGDAGFHSYLEKPKIIDDSWIGPRGLYPVNSEAIVVECEIPKNTLYLVNKRGEVISDQLMLLRVLPIKTLTNENKRRNA